ncbi:hypothetical protein [Desulfonatronovibrio hydrogenovorans]|uniref:hypothetical protein n=1 Tax=Desulfonatronovibrio hydrogenovorans TaxID=53245 RepID=UPI000553B6C5|nr:hypothetical protein [Desulfonatronovibrio hydrogenovorans]
MTSPLVEESVSEEIARLTSQMEDFINQRSQCRKKIRELMAAEDPKNRIFHHQEIFTLQQDSLRLEVEAELCRKKINRLNLGYQ